MSEELENLKKMKNLLSQKVVESKQEYKMATDKYYVSMEALEKELKELSTKISSLVAKEAADKQGSLPLASNLKPLRKKDLICAKTWRYYRVVTDGPPPKVPSYAIDAYPALDVKFALEFLDKTLLERQQKAVNFVTGKLSQKDYEELITLLGIAHGSICDSFMIDYKKKQEGKQDG